jgi:hypothetical protein
MTFTSLHRPLQSYFEALETVGMAVERLVEVPDETDSPGDRWQRLPLFLHHVGAAAVALTAMARSRATFPRDMEQIKVELIF